MGLAGHADLAERCRSAVVEIRWGKFIATGAFTATLTLAASVGALLI